MLKKIVYLLLIASYGLAFAQSDDENDKGAYVEAGAASLQLKYGTSYSYNLGTTYPIYAGYKLNKNLYKFNLII